MVNDKSALAVETMVKSSIVKPQGSTAKASRHLRGDASRQQLFVFQTHV